MAGAFWANQGWTYDRSYEDGVGWGTLSDDTCHGQHQISSGTWKWVKMDKTDDKVIFSWYDADTFAEADRFCSTTNTFTNPDRWDSINAIAFSTTGYNSSHGTHDYGFDDIEITSTVITQPYVAPVTYDLRFQSTLANAQSGAGLSFDLSLIHI